MVSKVFTPRNFYLLFFIRVFLMIIITGFLSHWKVVCDFFHLLLHLHLQTLLFSQGSDDFLISVVGGGVGGIGGGGGLSCPGLML